MLRAVKSAFYCLILLFVSSCHKDEKTFDKIECVSDSESTNTRINIYRPCREFIYRAKYWDENYDLISDQRIWMMSTGKTWKFSDRQIEVAIQYEYDEFNIERINEFNINEKYDKSHWVKSISEGFINNDSLLFFHPFRFNQYIFTEVAPFPQVQYSRLKIGESWSGNMDIHGWGDWDNASLKMNYEIVDLSAIQTEFQKLDSCWHISSKSFASFGSSTLDYWYNEQYGIVKMLYRNYKNQLLLIELKDVIDG